MLKRLRIILAVLLIAPVLLLAQESVEHDNILKIKIGPGYQLDTYLSPAGFRGIQYGIGNEWWQPFRKDTRLGKTGKLDHWAHVGRIDVTGNTYSSTSRSNSYIGVQITGGWGAHYEWRWLDDRLRVHTGPYLEAGLSAREILRNVNKIVSVDIALDMMAMGGVSWSFYGKKTSYRLNYLVRTNLFGMDFMPEYWQSYYELTEGVHGTTRFSGHWNHNTVKHEITLDMQFAHSTWRIGAEHEFVRYGTANMHFVRNQLSVIIGCRWKYRIHANARL